MKNRACKVLQVLFFLFALGLCYFILCNITDFRIPCIFHKITGFFCPGCGVTRMCLALLQFDIKTALQSNFAIFISLPFMILYAIRQTIRYIKYGKQNNSKKQSVFFSILAVLLVLFGILRNLPAFWFWQPLP